MTAYIPKRSFYLNQTPFYLAIARTCRGMLLQDALSGNSCNVIISNHRRARHSYEFELAAVIIVYTSNTTNQASYLNQTTYPANILILPRAALATPQNQS